MLLHPLQDYSFQNQVLLLHTSWESYEFLLLISAVGQRVFGFVAVFMQ